MKRVSPVLVWCVAVMGGVVLVGCDSKPAEQPATGTATTQPAPGVAAPAE